MSVSVVCGPDPENTKALCACSVVCVLCVCVLCVWPHAQHLPQTGVYLTQIGYPSTSPSGKKQIPPFLLPAN